MNAHLFLVGPHSVTAIRKLVVTITYITHKCLHNHNLLSILTSTTPAAKIVEHCYANTNTACLRPASLLGTLVGHIALGLFGVLYDFDQQLLELLRYGDQ